MGLGTLRVEIMSLIMEMYKDSPNIVTAFRKRAFNSVDMLELRNLLKEVKKEYDERKKAGTI